MNLDNAADLQECGNGSEYGSGSEETAALLSRPSVPAPILVAAPSTSSTSSSGSGGGHHRSSNSSLTSNSAGASSSTTVITQVSKPILQRQDRATFLVASPQLSVSGLGGSEESASAEDPATRSVPDIELHCRLDLDEPQQPISRPVSHVYQSHYRQRHGHQYRCQCERRDSLAPNSALHLARSVSR